MAPFTKSGHHQDKMKNLENIVLSRFLAEAVGFEPTSP